MSATDLAAEREIDLTRWRDALVRRWWVVAGGLVAGVIVGGLYSLGGGSVWEASVLLAPGQAFSPSGSPVLVYQSSPRAINEIATSESALVKAAAAARTSVDRLRGRVSPQSVQTGAGAAAARGAILIKITVQAGNAKTAAAAANSLGDIVVANTTSPYVHQSLKADEVKIANYNRQLTSLSSVIDQYNRVLATQPLAPLDKLVLVQQVDNALLRQGNLNDKITGTQATLTLLQNVEIAQIVSTASATKTTARSRRNSILVGALIGLLLGAIVAIVADPRLPRPRA
jgi:capsular polysaccharide biosynthesis protein